MADMTKSALTPAQHAQRVLAGKMSARKRRRSGKLVLTASARAKLSANGNRRIAAVNRRNDLNERLRRKEYGSEEARFIDASAHDRVKDDVIDSVTERKRKARMKRMGLIKRAGSTGPNLKSSAKEVAGSHGHKPHGHSILWPALYEHLRAKGYSKEKSARISNAAWNKKKAGLPTNAPTSVRGLAKSDDVTQLVKMVKAYRKDPDPRLRAAIKKLVIKTGRADLFEKVAPVEAVISKLDDAKQNVFGCAYVAKDHTGADVVDKSGDFVEHIHELEDAAYEFVLESRQGGADHRRDGDAPVVVSKMIESFVVTPEKLQAMGVPEGSLPTGAWWTGFHIEDPAVWADVKSGHYRMFSVHGTGVREAV